MRAGSLPQIPAGTADDARIDRKALLEKALRRNRQILHEKDDYPQFAIGPTLSLPIFEGGKLRAQLNLREAQQQEAALAYQRTVLGAWNDIDDTLSALSTEQQRRTSLTANVAQSDRAWQLATSRFQAGAGTRLVALAAQRTMLAAKLEWIRSDADVSLNAIRLYKALGGGWEGSGEAPLAAR